MSFKALDGSTVELLTAAGNDLPVLPPTATDAHMLEELGGVDGARGRFSVFLPSHQKLAIGLAAQFMAIANENPGEEGLGAVLAAARAAMAEQNSDLVKYALLVFITHHPEGRRLPIPPLVRREPVVALPSRRVDDGLEPLGALGDEAQLDYFREDVALNDHHDKWHIVYPGDGHPDPSDPFGPNVTKDRQGELFWYMHQQMLARYDTERAAFGLPPAVPLADYREPIAEGYEANLPSFSNRLPDALIEDFAVQGFAYTVADHEDRRDRLLTAAQLGVLRRPQADPGAPITTVPITAALLGDTQEATVGSADGVTSGPHSYYGHHHNFGHVLIANLPDPAGPAVSGVMITTGTAVRDPVFFRWHRHVDDIFVSWQDRLPDNDFSDAPPVRLRKGLAGAAAEAASPDILLARVADVPGADTQGFDLDAFGETTFGGAHWDEPPSAFGLLTDEILTTMSDEVLQLPDGSQIHRPFLDPEDFLYFVRLENSAATEQRVTVRVFLAAEQFVEDRRRWVEIDKFAQTLAAGARRVACRSARQSSVVRKPARRPTEPPAVRRPGTVDLNYCDCGWPYHLLLPRGSSAGIQFRLLVVLTDWQKDLVDAEKKCGSMSFCGARDAKYPDSRPMGYPFDRPFTTKSISQVIAAQDNFAARRLTIRHVKGGR